MRGEEAPLLWVACASGVAGVAGLRYAWSLSQRSVCWNSAGWAMLAGSTLCGWRADGAWGASVAALWSIGAAFVALAVAAVRAAPGPARAPRRRAHALPNAGEPRQIARRIVTFLIVVPLAMLASVALAVAIRGLGGALGWAESNANVAALFLLPLAWSALVFALLMQKRRRVQFATLAACVAVSAPFLLTDIGA